MTVTASNTVTDDNGRAMRPRGVGSIDTAMMTMVPTPTIASGRHSTAAIGRIGIEARDAILAALTRYAPHTSEAQRVFPEFPP
jgi:hypothetical protein